MPRGCLRRSRIVRVAIAFSLVSFLCSFSQIVERSRNHTPVRYEYVLKQPTVFGSYVLRPSPPQSQICLLTRFSPPCRDSQSSGQHHHNCPEQLICLVPGLRSIVSGIIVVIFVSGICAAVSCIRRYATFSGIIVITSGVAASRILAVFSVLAGWVILGERLSGRELFGCALVFAAVLLAQVPEKNLKTLDLE